MMRTGPVATLPSATPSALGRNMLTVLAIIVLCAAALFGSAGPALALSSPVLIGNSANAVVGQPYTFAYSMMGDPVPTASVTSGALPPGIELSDAGLLFGTPTAAGTYLFTVTATNGQEPTAFSSRNQRIIVSAAPTIAGEPQLAMVNQGYSFSYTVGGSPAPTVSVAGGALPPGLSVSQAGVLFGTPTTTGTFSFELTATNGLEPTASLESTLIVGETASITGRSTDGVVGQPYSYGYDVRGYPAPTVLITEGALPQASR